MATEDITFICSPYGGGLPYMNEDYAKRALKDSLDRGEAPFASHLLYTQALDDKNPEERRKGISCEQVFIDIALNYASMGEDDVHVILAVYYDNGISPGMRETISYVFHHQHSRCALIQWRSLEEGKIEEELRKTLALVENER